MNSGNHELNHFSIRVSVAPEISSHLVSGGNVIMFFYFSIFPVFANQAEMLNQIMAKFPPALLEAVGMNRADLSTVLGFIV